MCDISLIASRQVAAAPLLSGVLIRQEAPGSRRRSPLVSGDSAAESQPASARAALFVDRTDRVGFRLWCHTSHRTPTPFNHPSPHHHHYELTTLSLSLQAHTNIPTHASPSSV